VTQVIHTSTLYLKIIQTDPDQIETVVTSRARAWNTDYGASRAGNRLVQVWRNGRRTYSGWLSDMPSDFAGRS
jgi:hypothetical protein